MLLLLLLQLMADIENFNKLVRAGFCDVE